MKIITTLVVLFIASFASIDRVLADDVVTSGTFVGKSDHVTKGSASIEKDADGNYFVVLGEDFSFDGAPDPKVGLGNDGYQKKLSKLSSKKGKQVYSIPANLNPTDFNEIWIWCERFSVPLGVAKLS